MDIDFSNRIKKYKFKFRVAGVFFYKGKLLVSTDDNSDNYYLPGGRVKIAESSRQALDRELEEELGIKCSIVRPLYLVESGHFNEVNYYVQELSLFYLIDVDDPKKIRFLKRDHNINLEFAFVDKSELENLNFKPKVLKEHFNDLPDELTIVYDF